MIHDDRCGATTDRRESEHTTDRGLHDDRELQEEREKEKPRGGKDREMERSRERPRRTSEASARLLLSQVVGRLSEIKAGTQVQQSVSDAPAGDGRGRPEFRSRRQDDADESQRLC